MFSLLFLLAAKADVKWTLDPSLGKPNAFYVQNRAPLAPAKFLKLPIKAIQPKGWIRRQLELQANGFSGRLTEISAFLRKSNNAWLSKDGKGEHGWEETPYWLKGFGDLGYILNDPRIIKETKIWVEGVLGSQRADGYFGPEANKVANKGKPDVWPNMVMLDVLKSYYDYSGDKRVLTHIKRYCQWLKSLPDDSLLISYWEIHRGGDNLATVFWLYNRIGEPWLLDVAKKLHRRTADWVGGVPDYHGVNFAQAFREPATFFLLTGDENQLEATESDYQKMRAEYGQVPGGLFGADEAARPGFSDPRQSAETCAMVEMMLSDEMLLLQTGNPVWAERCEDVTFNSLPASMTADLKALRYLTSPNMIKSDRPDKNPGIMNSGPMFCMDPHDHRCCQHNVSHGWPYYSEHLWMATNDNGLAVALYGPSEVTAKVGKGSTVTLAEETNYPFEESIRFRVKKADSVAFPLILRLPTWCDSPSLKVNGKETALGRRTGGYLRIDRTWKTGDVVDLKLPMHIQLDRWKLNHDARSVQYGPLTFSLKIGEKYVRSGGTDAWPAWEIYPTAAWNYGLAGDASSMKVTKLPFPKDQQPFDANKAPIRISAKARQIPEWKEDYHGLVGLLQPSPAYTTKPVETVTLIPMGAARLRISAFPTVSTQSSATRWSPPQAPRPSIPAKASHVFPSDTVAALTDGLMPSSSDDHSIPRFTWWPRQGTDEWVELDFPKERVVQSVGVYWFDDQPSGGGCRTPQRWKVQYLSGSGEWRDVGVQADYPTEKDKLNLVAMTPVSTKALRISVRLKLYYSGGILEWIVK